MKKYLLDTNICIFYINGKFDLDQKIEQAGLENCFISEITVAELKFGASKSQKVSENMRIVQAFQAKLQILPIFPVLDLYAYEKARLQKAGNTIDDFDLLIGTTAVQNDLVMVTNNTKHFIRIGGIVLEDWTSSTI